jgi:hypothetical protein
MAAMPLAESGICGKPFIWGTCSFSCIDPGEFRAARFKLMKTGGLIHPSLLLKESHLSSYRCCINFRGFGIHKISTIWARKYGLQGYAIA